MPSKMPRMSGWWPWAGALLMLVFILNPADVPVVVYKMALISLAPLFGYYVDRSLFPYGRPDTLVDLGDDGKWETGESIVFAAAMLRRALVMAACVSAVAVAL